MKTTKKKLIEQDYAAWFDAVREKDVDFDVIETISDVIETMIQNGRVLAQNAVARRKFHAVFFAFKRW